MNPSDPPSPLRLLLVENNRAEGEVIIATLQQAGYRLNFDVVDLPSTFEDRIRNFEYDLILSDHDLSTWTGMEAHQILRDSGREIPFIVVTSTLGDEAAVLYMKRGAANYVLKDRLEYLPIAVGQALRDVAHRKDAAKLEEHIRRAKREWELTFDAVTDPVLVIGEDCRIKRANRATTKVFNLTFKEIIGKPCYEVIHGRTDPLASCPHQCVLSTGQNAQGDVEEPRLGKTFHSSTSVLRDPDGTLRGCVHILRDVTEQKRSEQALRREALTFENIYEAVIATDGDYNITDWNPAATRIFGYDKTEVLGRNVSCLHPPEKADGQLLKIRGEIESAGRWDGELNVVRKDGRKLMVRSVIVPFRDEQGVQIGTIGVSRDITERKRAENALRQSEEKFRTLLDSTAEAIYGLDVHGHCTFCNPASLRLLGYQRPEDMLEKNMHSLIHHTRPDGSRYAEESCHILHAIRQETGFHSADELLWRADGTSFPAEYWAYPIYKDGQRVGAVVTFLDISERKQAENALLESEEKYRLLFESNPQPMWVYHVRSLRFLAVNQAAVDHYGYSREEFLSMTLKDIRPAEDISAMLTSALNVPEPIDKAGVWRHRTKDGRIIHVEITDCRVRIEGQSASLVSANDITDRILAERALQESEEKYRELVENATYGMFCSTVDGALLDANPAFVGMLGYDSKDELLALNLARDVYEDARAGEIILHGYDTQAKRVDGEANLRRKDGSVIKVKMSGRTVRNAEGRIGYFEVIAEDVTQQRALEEQFRQAQKMEAVGQLAGGIAHDFNNVLMIVNSYAEMILDNGSLDPTMKRHTEQILQAGRKASSLVSQLLAFSRKQMRQPTVLNLASVATELGKMLPRILGEDIEMSLVMQPGLGQVHADRAQIEQVIMNLAVNARDAMPRGGKLRIELKNVHIDADEIGIRHAMKPGDYVSLVVGDTGTGMDATTKAKIFEPFFTTKPVGKGTGLGLATVYGIVKQSGGFIWVYSEPGLGTTFKIYLPRVHGEVATASELKDKKQDNGGNCETILLVDDDRDVRSAAREFLEGNGYRVLEAENGAGALAVCTAYNGPIAALVTDLVMPGMRGPELAAKISKLHPDIKTLYMSGYTDHSKDVEDLGPEAVFLQKPFSLKTLAQKLHSAVQQ